MIFVDSRGQATVQPVEPLVPRDGPTRPSEPGPDSPSEPLSRGTGGGGEHLVRLPRTLPETDLP